MLENIMINEQLSHTSSLFQTVIRGGYCIGCGACAAVKNSPFNMKLDEFGKFQATSDTEKISVLLEKELESVCPFSDESVNEDMIGKELIR